MKKLSERALHKGRWLTLKETTFEAEGGQRIRWESIERRSNLDVVVVLAHMKRSGSVVLISQYRPAIDKHIIGFPAGIVEEGTVEACALKELAEETGYTGRIVQVSPPLTVNAAISRDHSYLVVVEIDEDDPINRDPRPRLEPAEEIVTHVVPRGRVREFLGEQRALGKEIGSGVWYLFCAASGPDPEM